MQIGFTQFSKRENSTKRPALDTFTFYDGVFKLQSGILSPILLLTLQGADGRPLNPVNWNYAYIPEFKRYYYVKEWVTNNGQWAVFLAVDVMATYKEFIGTSTQYVLRAASAHDGRVVDTRYPALNYVTTSKVFESSGMSATGGSYILGVINGTVGRTGSVSYYVMDSAEIAYIMNWLLTQGNYQFTDDLAFAILNPIRYIVSCVYVPFSVPAANVDAIKVGFWTVEGATGRALINPSIGLPSIILTIADHPQSDRGVFLNKNPFTRANLSCRPFGLIPIDLFKVSDNTIVCDIECDVTNGLGSLSVYSGGNLLGIYYAQIGVSLAMAQGASNALVGTANTLLVQSNDPQIAQFEKAVEDTQAKFPDFNVPSSAGLSSVGNAGAAVMTSAATITGVGNAIKSLMPQLQVTGSQGFFGNIDELMTLYIEYIHIVDEDNDDIGRPLMQKRVINTLSGYILVNSADLAIDGYAGELASVKSYMNGGFFYE